MSNLEKEFIPYEQALALKELGLDGPCFGYYKENQYELNKEFHCYNSDYVEHLGVYIAAPLYQQAFRWFREKYKIRFIIQSSMSDLGEYFKVIFPNGEQRGVSYNTYEEAEIACIKQLIEIVKNQ